MIFLLVCKYVFSILSIKRVQYYFILRNLTTKEERFSKFLQIQQKALKNMEQPSTNVEQIIALP